MNHPTIIKTAALLLAALTLLGSLAACGGSPDVGDSTNPSADTTAELPATDAPGTETALPSGPDSESESESEPEVETVPPLQRVEVPDPSTVTLTIEDFNGITDVQGSLKPADLSMFGISAPTYAFDEGLAQEGQAFVTVMTGSSWCQLYQIDDARLDVFEQATEELYLRMWVSSPDNVSLAITAGLGDGTGTSFLDATRAVITELNGDVYASVTSNATGDAGEDSAVTIPAGFEGYVAFPLKGAKAWAGKTGLSSLSAVRYLKLDIRPSGSGGERYALDALCLSDSPHARTVTVTGGNSFDSKNKELDYMIEQALQTDVIFEYCSEYDPEGYPNIKALWIEGMPMGDRKTKVFALIGYPVGASQDAPVPAVVLNHGGGGFAYPSWVDLWNQRGYAAIAICNTGYYPAAHGTKDFYNAAAWTHTVPAEVQAKDPRVLPPDNDGMYTSTGRIDRMWMYHAVTQTILANSILRGDRRVDPDRIGITGISWGGVITSIAIGYDSRFAFAIPVYGSGYLHESLSWMKQHFNAAGTRELWDASLRLKDVKMPVLWLAWTNDTCFSINTNSKSFEDTENGALTLLMNLGHGHLEGWAPGEIYRFADSVVKGGQPLTTCKTQPGGVGEVSFDISVPSDASRVVAKLYYLTEKMTYSEDSKIEQTWSHRNALVSGGKVSVDVPEDAWSYYVEITTLVGSERYVTTSQYVVVKE